jgi:tetratricopeptide (TPR) repeat protein
MSPEQAGGQAVDARADVYSLGCVLYQMLAGDPPFRGDSAREILTKQMVGEIPSIDRKDLPPHFEATVRRALAKDPNDRFQSAADLGSALAGHILPFGPAWKRRQRRRGLAVAGAIAALATAGWFALRAPPAIALDANRILVFPVTDDDLPADDAGAGLDAAVLIITALEHAPPLKWDDGWRWMLPEHRSDPALLSADSARDIATALRARYFVDGEFHSRRDSATLFLRLHDVAGDSVYARAVASGPLEEGAYSSITLAALTELLPRLIDPGRPPPDVSAVADRSPPAITAFLQGERAYRSARYPEAQSYYSSAVERDSLFAFAALKGALAAGWTHDTLASEAFLRAVVPSAEALPRRYASFYEGIRAYENGMADSAIVAFETSLEESPRWPEALTALGETHYHLNPTGKAETLAGEFFQAAAEADSGFVPPLLHLAQIAIRSGDLAAADSIVRRYRAARPTYGQGQLDLMLRCATDGPGSVDWEEEALEGWVDVFGVANSLSVGLAHIECARPALDALVDNPRPEDRNINWGTFLMYHNHLHAAREYEQIQAIFEDVEGPAANAVPYLYVLDAIMGAPAPFPDSAASLEGWLRQEFDERFETLRAPQALWVASIWNAHIGDTARLELVRAAQEAVAAESDRPMWRRRGARFTVYAEADLARLRGDTALAIERFEAIPADAPTGSLAWEMSDPLVIARLRHAELLAAVGRYEEAIEIASAFDSPAAVLFSAYVPASLAIRHAAARAAGLSGQEREFRERLVEIGRSDLLGES